jgi:hypothetical protein
MRYVPVFSLTCVVSVALLSQLSTAQGAAFECAFIQDKYPTGRPHKATCAMLPEHVFALQGYTPKPSDHCEVDVIHGFEDLIDMHIDTQQPTVVWTEHRGLIEAAKPKQRDYLMKEQGYSRQKAEREVAGYDHKDKRSFAVVAYHLYLERIHVDPVTRQLLEPPREVPAHTLILSNRYNLYYLYIPESTGHAILLYPAGNGESSWVGIRFGKCRKLR